MKSKPTHRVVVTGMGAVTPLGIGVSAFWNALLEGRSGVSFATRYDIATIPYVIAAEVRDFDPRDHMDAKAARRMARFAQFAVAAAGEALRDSGLNLDAIDRTQIAVDVGTSLGGTAEVEEQALTFETRGRRRVDAFYMPTFISNMASCQVAMQYGLRGPTTTPVLACATGTYAIGEAARMVHRGDALVAVCGGTDAGVTALNAMAFGVIGAIAPPGDDPARAVRPFDAHRKGTAGGEGCGILVLEQLEHALARGARIYAEVAGFGATGDAYHLTAPAPGGEFAALAINRAIDDAGLRPEDVDHISAHGTGTPLNDAAETAAIKRALGDHAYRVTVSGIKSMIGHTAGAAGALAAIGCIKSIETGMVPPTINYETPDPACDLDYVPDRARRQNVRVALANAFGFGGQNAVVLFRRYEDHR
ncbi:beta-ketoacyl-ACP synthase II [Roseiflexus castenholzii]|jgi:3-oxoacyl-[acyl-carrier-protein] synthase II|uniref:3-oxoacyl-[acyl-carrier-protein] synthase 2 n=1 Tax=Roseiflexus castenholzii (strain DSM 13941 / HLO8) TaxID=383372 RepID=A7NSA2_ROSCS|nr:beta-ketoacyl-ACP synthase II [Roseiflexus castenholzii]ABU60448.1 Beta-ketoacyl synthase [Roseiflexus castenholzii DSM 13941]